MTLPPIEPSQVLFGEIAVSLCLPICLPTKYAPESVIQTIKKAYIKVSRPASRADTIMPNPKPTYIIVNVKTPASSKLNLLRATTVCNNIKITNM